MENALRRRSDSNVCPSETKMRIDHARRIRLVFSDEHSSGLRMCSFVARRNQWCDRKTVAQVFRRLL